MHPKRLRRLRGRSYTGFARYSLTFCTRQRRSVFTNARLVDLALMQILRSATAGGFEVIAYCAMPDHLHLLVEATAETASLPEFVKGAKQRSSFHTKVLLGAPLWQTGYFERVLRSEQETKALALYTIQNPVRAGLVADAGDYPYIGSSRYTVRELIAWLQDVDTRPT